LKLKLEVGEVGAVEARELLVDHLHEVLQESLDPRELSVLALEASLERDGMARSGHFGLRLRW
jgi:hypothetical protein